MPARDALKGELRTAWTRKLAHWWRHYNEEYLAAELRAPMFGIGRGERTLGQWDGIHRTLMISEAHIVRDPWLTVMETLRHEMAHQYVDEVLRPEGGGPHGPAFQKACRRLRCSSLPGEGDGSSEPAGTGEEDGKILRVLKKVLSLAGSPNEHEAQSAVQKARYLLAKYNIDLIELDRERRFGNRCLGEVKGRRAPLEIWLASILNEFFFVEVIWAHSYDAARDRAGTILQIFGTPENLEMAEYVYDYVLQLLGGLWEAYKAHNGLRGNRERQRFFSGVVEGLYNKLRDQDRRIQQTEALVWKGDPALQSYYRYFHPRIRTRYGGGVSRTPAYRDGLREGARVTIHKPIGDRGTGRGGYLGEGGGR
jgi:hypothetical protein